MRFLVSYRFAIVGAIAVGNALADASARLGRISDWHLFDAAGTALLSGNWDAVSTGAGLQVGPATLVGAGVLNGVAALTRVPEDIVLAVVVYLSIALGSMVVVRKIAARTTTSDPDAMELGAGLLVVISGIPLTTVVSGHPAEALIPLLWMAAMVDAARERGVRSGAWLALATCLKPWGLLGVPVVLAARTRTNRLQAAGLALGGSVLLYLPLLVLGEGSGMFSYVWTVRDSTLLALVVDPGSSFGWDLRVVQGLVVGAAGVAAVRVWRGPSVYWVVPLVLVLVRLITDPLLFGYYWVAAEVVVVVGVMSAAARAPVWITVTSTAALLAAAYASFLGTPGSSVARFVLLAGIVAAAYVVDRRPVEREEASATSVAPKGATGIR